MRRSQWGCFLVVVALAGAGAIDRSEAQEAGKSAAPLAEAPAQAEAPATKSANESPVPAAPLPGPPEISPVTLGPTLKTVPVRRGEVGPNVQMVDAKVLPRDKEGIWVLNFAFKPMRLRTVEIPGKGRRTVHYLYYQVINNTEQPRMFVPQFTLVTDTGRRYEDMVIPQSIPVIQAREDASRPLLGAVDVVGMLPVNGSKEGIDDVIFGVAVWEGVDPSADKFSVYVRGLSDGYQMVTPPGGSAPVPQYKTLRIDFLRPGDERDLNEREIRMAQPPYEWVYW